MAKPLKFSDPLPELVLSGKKDITWRINDEKDISLGDELSLVRRSNGQEFAKAIVIWVKETTFGALTDEDMAGHEKFDDNAKMYETYAKYYNEKITPATPLKVIKFRLA